jgi:hypothetical protein
MKSLIHGLHNALLLEDKRFFAVSTRKNLIIPKPYGSGNCLLSRRFAARRPGFSADDRDFGRIGGKAIVRKETEEGETTTGTIPVVRLSNPVSIPDRWRLTG